MELESLAARVAQLEKDLAECRAKVFFLEAVKSEERRREPEAKRVIHIPGDEFELGPRGSDPEPKPKLSPFAFAPFGTEKPIPEEEKAIHEILQIREELFENADN